MLVENKLNELPKNVEVISTKRLTKDLINGYKVLKGARYFLQEHNKIIWYIFHVKNI